ncbi:hypothetical protein [Brevibacterium sp. SMBL_HHYL_HB1]|uniref:hypothetical protein n=1 Tax=Brevibacterium sp. SMBL_HHYL_HB1 TaxID=2777556 RepID=UPI001BA4640D|nr:hypothetical protein [Brevibacterium sp. SMBL_HHYL_HB1]QUL80641.1 hypothetical protein IG171_07755 [Brevibacterium sp. SMBL_HHYL_HB1]
MPTIDTRTEAEQYVIDAIEAGDATRHEFDIHAITDHLYDLAGGTWDIQHIEHEHFWRAVEAGAR